MLQISAGTTLLKYYLVSIVEKIDVALYVIFHQS